MHCSVNITSSHEETMVTKWEQPIMSDKDLLQPLMNMLSARHNQLHLLIVTGGVHKNMHDLCNILSHLTCNILSHLIAYDKYLLHCVKSV